MMPTRRRFSSTMGTPEMRNRCMRCSASLMGRSGGSVMGSRIMPLSERLTGSTSAPCRSMGRFLWITPMPPRRAMAIAISDSVTASMAAETNGMLSAMPRVRREATSTLRGWIVEWRGTRRTSSNASASSARIRLSMAEDTGPARDRSSRFGPLPPGRPGRGRRGSPRPARDLVDDRLARGRETLHQAARGRHRVHRAAHDAHADFPDTQRVFHGIGELLERRAPGRALGEFRFEEFDVVQHLVHALVGQRLQLAHDALGEQVVHWPMSTSSRIGFERYALRPFRTRATTVTDARGSRRRISSSLASGIVMYKHG